MTHKELNIIIKDVFLSILSGHELTVEFIVEYLDCCVDDKEWLNLDSNEQTRRVWQELNNLEIEGKLESRDRRRGGKRQDDTNDHSRSKIRVWKWVPQKLAVPT